MLDVVHIRDPGEPQVTIDRHLYLTEDRTRVVEEGDPAGRWLWASPGQQVSRREAERLGAIVTESGPDVKQAEAPANKQRRPAVNKSGGAPEGKRNAAH